MKWLWLIGNLVLLGAAFSHTSDAGAVVGRYSVTYTAGLAVSAALVGCATFLGFTRHGQRAMGRAAGRLDALVQRHGLKAVAALALLLLAGFTLLFSLPADIQYVELLLLFNATMLIVSLGMRPTSVAAQADASINRLLWLLLAAVLAVSFFSAHAVPHEQGHGDEAAWTNMAETLRTSGQAYIKISGHSPVTIPPGAGWWVAPYAVWLNVFGVSLSSGRVFIWLFYLAAVASIGWAGARLYDRTTGLIAAILTAASPFVLTFRIIRPEIGLAAIGALLLVLYLASRKRPLWGFAAGLLATLSLEIHAAGLAYIVALILMFASDALAALIQRRNPFERRQFAAIAGLALGTAIYWVTHILIQADPAAYFAFLRSSRDFLSGLPSGDVLARTVASYWERSPLELLLTGLAVIALLVRRTPSDRIILRFFAFTLAAYLLLVPEPFTYLIILMPFMALGLASLLTWGTTATPAQSRNRYALVAAATLCAPFLALSLPGVSPNPMPATEITPVMQRARELSTPDEVVAGDGFAWWGFTDYPEFYAFWAEWEATRGLSDVASENMWETLQPALIFMVYYPGFPDMPPAMRTYLDEHGFVLVDSFEWEGHPAEFYRRPDGAS
ncbi:MAG: hypothetical protein JNL34_09670 [Anaerolineae bacterium]|nr:hypothetical protein [Anaerolineae bacterium]